MDRFLYQGNKTNQISFPLGGLGTGCIGLAGNGRLIDWEIFNRPNSVKPVSSRASRWLSAFKLEAQREHDLRRSHCKCDNSADQTRRPAGGSSANMVRPTASRTYLAANVRR